MFTAAICIVLQSCSSPTPAVPEYVPSLDAREKLKAAVDLEAEGKLRDALAASAAAVDLDSKFPEARYMHARLLTLIGSYEDARVAVERLLSEKPDYPEAQLLKGHLLEKAGVESQARIAYGEAVKVYAAALESSNVTPKQRVEHAVALYLHQGMVAALPLMEKVWREYPEYEPARVVREHMLADDRRFFLDRVISPTEGIRVRTVLPVATTSDTELTHELLEPLTVPEPAKENE